jgi:hypothetical protein
VGVGLTVISDNALRAIERQANSQGLFFRALCEYNKNIAVVHFRKNSLLEFNGVWLAEGPWPAKAYFDAEGHARRRAAGYYLDYGWMEPPPVSVGPAPQGIGPPSGISAPYQSAPLEEVEPVPAPLPEPERLPDPNDPGLAPPMPPGGIPPGMAGGPGALPAAWQTSAPGGSAALPPSGIAPLATSYPSYHDGVPSAMSYRALGAPQSGSTLHGAPDREFSSRREAVQAAYAASAGQSESLIGLAPMRGATSP